MKNYLENRCLCIRTANFNLIYLEKSITKIHSLNDLETENQILFSWMNLISVTLFSIVHSINYLMKVFLKIKITNSIIICTSNYLNRAEIKQHLGEPIYSRFDSIIEFSPLSNNDKVKILNSEFNNYYKKLEKNEKKLLAKDNLINILLKEGLRINNIREIKTFISDLVDTSLVQTIFS